MPPSASVQRPGQTPWRTTSGMHSARRLRRCARRLRPAWRPPPLPCGCRRCAVRHCAVRRRAVDCLQIADHPFDRFVRRAVRRLLGRHGVRLLHELGFLRFDGVCLSFSTASASFWGLTRLLVSAPPVVTAIPRSAARVSDDNTEFALDAKAVNDGGWTSRFFSGVGEVAGGSAAGGSAAGESSVVSGFWAPSFSAAGGGSVAVESGSGPAQATP